jgi:Ni,Fe-hydrogenase III large subunit
MSTVSSPTVITEHGGASASLSQQYWSSELVDSAAWEELVARLGKGETVLLGLWAEPQRVYLAYSPPGHSELRVASFEVEHRSFPSVARVHLPALRLERSIQDLFRLRAVGTPDDRPWLDHGTWPSVHLLGMPGATTPGHSDYKFLPVDGDDLHEVPVGPVHAGIIEPGHFRFTVSGETVIRLEERLGYTHKGIQELMRAASLERASRLAGRVSGDSTVTYAWAFSRAVEMATGTEPPSRAVWLRALMAELERIANHFGDIGGVCNDVAFTMLHAYFGALRERVLACADTCFGHRLMMDQVLPGGVASDLSSSGVTVLNDLVHECRAQFGELVELYDNTASLQDRVARTGVVKRELAMRFGCGGFVGRASGRSFDTRRAFPYAPYDQLEFIVPVREEGDVNARVWIRIREVEQSFSLIEQILARLPEGPVRTEVNQRPGSHAEGLSLVEGFRGDVLAWVRMNGDEVAACHLRDPSWFQWPVLEAAIEGNIIADFPVCNKSFNCSYSGHDL